MENIKIIICNIISRILLDEEEIKVYHEKCDDLQVANILLNLQRTNIMLMPFVDDILNLQESCNEKAMKIMKQIYKVSEDEELRKEWQIFAQNHVHFWLENMVDINPAVQKYLLFEVKKLNNELSEEEVWEQGDNEEIIISFLDAIVANEEILEREEDSLRLLFESVLLLNLHITERTRFQDIIKENKAMLKGQLALEDD